MPPIRHWLIPVRTLGLVTTCLGLWLISPVHAQQTCSAIAPLPERQNLPDLLPGDRGADVRTLQTLLTLMGHYDGAIDGIFSDGLTQSVQRFQESAGLPTTGRVTTDTWAKLLPRQVSSDTCREAP